MDTRGMNLKEVKYYSKPAFDIYKDGKIYEECTQISPHSVVDHITDTEEFEHWKNEHNYKGNYGQKRLKHFINRAYFTRTNYKFGSFDIKKKKKIRPIEEIMSDDKKIILMRKEYRFLGEADDVECYAIRNQCKSRSVENCIGTPF